MDDKNKYSWVYLFGCICKDPHVEKQYKQGIWNSIFPLYTFNEYGVRDGLNNEVLVVDLGLYLNKFVALFILNDSSY